MDHITLSQKIKLHPRMCIIRGIIFERKKANGSLNAIIPHYATNGVPLVQFDAESHNPINIQNHGAEIECNIKETDEKIQKLNARYFSNHMLVQLMYGKRGEPPSQAACRILNETSICFKKLIDSEQEIYVAGLFILKVSGASSDGLLVPMGIFSLHGDTIWINPEAIELELISAPFPHNQIEHNSQDRLHWYDHFYENLRHIFQGTELHDRILESRAKELAESGKAKNQEVGLSHAVKEFRSFIQNTTLNAKLSNDTIKQTIINDKNNRKLTKTNAKTSNTKITDESKKLSVPRTFTIKKIRGD